MKLTLIQADQVWKDPAANRDRVRQLVMNQEDTDLIILPEMFATGFVTEPEGVAESDDSESLKLMKELAAARNCAIAGSLAIREQASGAYRNRFYFVKPDGSVRYYDKHHLFTHSGEHLRYSPGEERVVVEYKGVRILLQVCYDLRFPVFCRNKAVGAGADYDLIIYVASWPVQRIAAWDALLKARAIENQCYVAGVNRVGEDPGNKYSGHSTFIDPYGKILSICKENEVDSKTCEIDLPLLVSFRNTFPVLQDADLH